MDYCVVWSVVTASRHSSHRWLLKPQIGPTYNSSYDYSWACSAPGGGSELQSQSLLHALVLLAHTAARHRAPYKAAGGTIKEPCLLGRVEFNNECLT